MFLHLQGDWNVFRLDPPDSVTLKMEAVPSSEMSEYSATTPCKNPKEDQQLSNNRQENAGEWVLTFSRYLWLNYYFFVKGPAANATDAPQTWGLLCNPVTKMIFLVFPCNWAPVEWHWQGKTKIPGENPVPVPLCPPQIPHGMTQDRTRALRGERRATNRLSHSTAKLLR